MDKKTALARLEYYDEQVADAERALEYRREQRQLALDTLGEIVLREMLEDGTLS